MLDVTSKIRLQEVELDDHTIVVPKRIFESLPEYSCTMPTGTTVGKKWRRRVPYETGPGIENEWWLGEYVEHPDPRLVGVRWRAMIVMPEFGQIEWKGYC